MLTLASPKAGFGRLMCKYRYHDHTQVSPETNLGTPPFTGVPVLLSWEYFHMADGSQGLAWGLAPPPLATLVAGLADLTWGLVMLRGTELGWRKAAGKYQQHLRMGLVHHFFKQCHHWQAWLVGFEREAPEFPPSL